MRRRPSPPRAPGLADVNRPLIEERHHPLRPWLAAGAVLLAVLGIAFAFYYSPLTATALACPPPAELVPAPESDVGVVEADRCLITGSSEAARVTLGTVLRNEGRLGTTVRGVALDEALAGLVTVEELRLGQGTGEARPFAPFALGPGEAQAIELTLEVGACDPERGERLITIDQLPVRTRFLGVPKTSGAALETELSVLRSRC